VHQLPPQGSLVTALFLNYHYYRFIPYFRLNNNGHRAFSFAGLMVFFIRDLTSSTDCFRCLLKTYLFARTCSRVTSASSTLGVLNDYVLYKFTHSLTRGHCVGHLRFQCCFSLLTSQNVYKKSWVRVLGI